MKIDRKKIQDQSASRFTSHRWNCLAFIAIAILLALGGVGCNYQAANVTNVNETANQTKLPAASEFTNDSPERLFDQRDFIVRSFVNPERFSCSVHIIQSEKGNIIVDPGYYGDDLMDYIETIGGVDAILLTHCHVDHILGLNELKKDYPNASVYINEIDQEGLYDPSLNFSNQHKIVEEDIVIDCDVIALHEGIYNCSGYDVEVIHTPGHSPGSSLFYFKDENILFIGDTIAFGGIPRYDLPNSNVPELYESIEKIKHLEMADDTELFFGHGEHASFNEMLTTYDCFTEPLVLRIKTNDDVVTAISDSYFDQGILMLPIQMISEQIGADCYWNSDTGTTSIRLPQGENLNVIIGDDSVEVDGRKVVTEAVAEFREGDTFVSGKFIAEEFREYLDWILEPEKEIR